jgi:hypothetical protein
MQQKISFIFCCGRCVVGGILLKKNEGVIIVEINDISKLPLVLSVIDVARIMNISRILAYNLAHSNGFPCKQVGKRLIIPRDSFFRWLNGFEVNDICINNAETSNKKPEVIKHGS